MEKSKAALPQPKSSTTTLTPSPSPSGRGEREDTRKNVYIYGKGSNGAFAAARHEIGNMAVVIPVYAAPHIEPAELTAALNDTVLGCLAQGIVPQQLCLSVDGAASDTVPAATVSRQHGVKLAVTEINRGKLAAVRHGVAALQVNSEWRTLAVLDQDGDHFANDLVAMMRMANHLRNGNPSRRLLVLGERLSRHRPMGFLRGELEELADRVLLDALMYDAAISGRPLPLEYALVLGEFPDFHSGFKLFDRRTALDVFMSEPRLCGATETAYYRHAVEAVMTVEALAAGAILAGVSRRTVNGQAFTTFGVMDRCRLVADKMIWPLRRLAIPTPFVIQWVANHLGRLQLHTMAPQGYDELRRIAAMVIDACNGDPDAVEQFEQPPFV